MGPVVMRFPYGSPKILDSDEINFTLYNDKTNKNKNILIGSNSYADYIGKNYGKSDKSLNNQQYAIGFITKSKKNKKKKLKLISLDHIYEMKQKMRQINDHMNDKSDDDDDNNNNSINSYLSKRRKLVELFGSKKRKKIVRSQDANRININEKNSKSLLSSIKNAAKNVSSSTQNDIKTNNSSSIKPKSDLLPLYNSTTEDVTEIYQLDNLIYMKDFNSLDVTVSLFFFFIYFCYIKLKL